MLRVPSKVDTRNRSLGILPPPPSSPACCPGAYLIEWDERDGDRRASRLRTRTGGDPRSGSRGGGWGGCGVARAFPVAPEAFPVQTKPKPKVRTRLHFAVTCPLSRSVCPSVPPPDSLRWCFDTLLHWTPTLVTGHRCGCWISRCQNQAGRSEAYLVR